MSTTGGITHLNLPVVPGTDLRQSPGTLLGDQLISTGNTASNLVKDDDAGILYDSAARFKDALDELSTSIRMRQLRGSRLQDDLPDASASESELDEEGHQKVENLTKIVKADPREGASKFLQQARALFPDDSDLVIALREMLKNRRLTPAERRCIEDALDQIEQEADLKRLRSGINVALKAKLYGERMSLNPGSIREAYRDFVVSKRQGLESYQAWISIFGPPKRSMMVDFIESALMADRDATQPSSNDDDFGILLGKLQEIKTIRTADKMFLEMFISKKSIQAVNPSETDWLFFLFSILANVDLVEPVLQETVKTGFTFLEAREKAEITQWLYFCLHRLPVEVFVDERAHGKLLESIKSLTSSFYQQELTENNPNDV
jgi:type III secretion protein W